MFGRDGDDELDGGGGADEMLGGAGNDTYYVDSTGDKVYETTTMGGTTDAGGTDMVRSSVSHTLGRFVEKLVLTGANAVNGTGNAQANSLTGNAGANILNGSGADTMLGGAGSDTYVVDNLGDKVYETDGQPHDQCGGYRQDQQLGQLQPGQIHRASRSSRT